MTDQQKIQLADIILQFIAAASEDKSKSPQMVGTLNKRQGIRGFKPAEIGTPVFDTGDRYLVLLESIDGKLNWHLSFYKEELQPYIEFGDAIKS